MEQEKYKYFISYSASIADKIQFFNEEVHCKLIENKDDIKDIEKDLGKTYVNDITIINYRMF